LSEFAHVAVSFIRGRAARVRGTRDYEVVELAAYLYAIGCELLAGAGNARMVYSRRDPPGLSLDEMLDRLAGLPDGIHPEDLYWALVDALLVCEDLICRRRADATALPGSTRLEEIPVGDGRHALGGEVLHWIRPKSVLGHERKTRYEAAPRHKRPQDPEPHPGTYLSRLGMYWHSDRQLPRLSRFDPGERLIPLIRESGRDAAERDGFRIALCPLAGEFHPLFEVWPAGDLFRAADPGMAGADALAAHLERLMDAAAEEGVHLLVLPELTVDLPARRALAARLAADRPPIPPYGVVAGSFHLLDCGYDRPCANESMLLDHAGAPLAAHHKRGRFRFPAVFLDKAPHLFSRIHPAPEPEIREDIEYGSELQIVETTLGRLALLICADGLVADDKGYLPVIRRLRPDLLFVIAMSPETEPFEDLFKEMSRYWVGTVFVNAHCVGGFGKSPQLAACDLALHEPAGRPPTRVRWRYGQEDAECIYYYPVDGNLGWRPLGNDTGASLWKHGGETLGLLLDLGVHLGKP
jgi:predicted amidohydrolase